MITKNIWIKQLKILLLLLPAVFLLLYCQDTEETLEERANRIRDKDNDPIRTTGSEEYYGEYVASDYDGSKCKDLRKDEDKEDDYKKCEDICDRLYHKDASDCEKLPIDLISELDELFTSMIRIRANENQLNRRVDGFNFGVMIDVSVEPVIRLLRDWSEREIKEFLIWTATNSPISLALKYHDQENRILKSAFRKVGKGQGSGSSSVEYGVGEDLQGGGKTFWVIATQEKNPSAFDVAHKMVESECSGKEGAEKLFCILRFYCVREEFERNVRRGQCRYSSDRRFSKARHCYLHGPDVWSYWTRLKSEEKIKSQLKSVKMNEEKCDKACRTCSDPDCGGQICKREI